MGSAPSSSSAHASEPGWESLEQLAQELAGCEAAYPLTQEFFSWCKSNAPETLLPAISARLQAGEAYDDIWFYEAGGVSLHVLYGRFRGDDAMENWHERESAGAKGAQLLFTGDVHLDDDWEIMRALTARGGGVEEAFSQELLERMRGADVLTVNNEFAYSLRGAPLAGKLYTFCADPARTAFLRAMGTDLAGLANNHVFDYGPEAFGDTLAALNEAGVPYVGAGRNREEAMRPQYFIVDGLKIAFVAATRAEKFLFTQEAQDDLPGVLRTYDPELFLKAIHTASQSSDYTVAYVHWGTENTTVLEDVQRQQARQYIDAGADAVVGTHPHCLQGFEFYNGKLIAYSLGNFWFNTDTVDTGLLDLRVTAPEQAQAYFWPCLQAGGYTACMDDAQGAELLQRLQMLSPGVVFGDDGALSME